MPAVTYLNDYEIREWGSIKDDKDADDLLQELRSTTGENWLVGVRPILIKTSVFKKPRQVKRYTLYADCHGEWQVMNLCTPDGDSIFHGGAERSREDVMNFMLGMLAGWHDAKKVAAP